METTFSRENRRLSGTDRLLVLLAGALTFGVCYVFALRGIDPHHDGIMLKTAVDVSRGLALYRETFSQYGSLVTYVFALFVRVFGERVTSILLATCLAYAFSAMTLYALVRRYAPRLVALCCPLVAVGLAAFYFWNFHPWSSVFVLLLTLLAALFLVRWIERAAASMERGQEAKPQWRVQLNLFSCGVCAAAMFWCRQPAGLSAVFGTLVLLLLWATGFAPFRRIFRAFLWFLAGNLALHAVFFAVLAIQRALPDWWIQAVKNAFVFAAEPTPETAANMPDSLWKLYLIGLDGNPGYDFLWRVLTHGSLLYLVGLVVLALRRKTNAGERARIAGLIAMTAFALTGWVQYYPTLCYRHVFWSDYPLVGVAGVALYQGVSLLLGKCGVSRKRAGFSAVLACALLLALCASNLLVRFRLGKARLLGGGTGASLRTVEYAEEDTTLRYERTDFAALNGLYLSARETRFYDALFDTLSALAVRYPEKNIVNLTPNALFSVFSRENAHLHAFDVKADGYPDQPDAVASYIRANRPILLSNAPVDGYETAAFLTDFNGDAFRFAPMYILVPTEE